MLFFVTMARKTPDTLTPDEAKKAAKRERARKRREAAVGSKAAPTKKKRAPIEDPDDFEFEIPDAPRRDRSASERSERAARRKTGRDRHGSEKVPEPPAHEESPVDPFAPVVGKRGCHGRNLYNEPCGLPALKPNKVCTTKEGEAYTAELGWCMRHQPNFPDVQLFGLGGPQKGAGPKKRPSVDEVMRKVVVDAALVFLEPHLRALGVDLDPDTLEIRRNDTGGLRLFGTSKDGEVFVSDYEDLGGQMKAAELILDRVFGRPKQSTEISGKDGTPVVLDMTPSDEKAAQIAAAMKEADLL